MKRMSESIGNDICRGMISGYNNGNGEYSVNDMSNTAIILARISQSTMPDSLNILILVLRPWNVPSLNILL